MKKGTLGMSYMERLSSSDIESFMYDLDNFAVALEELNDNYVSLKFHADQIDVNERAEMSVNTGSIILSGNSDRDDNMVTSEQIISQNISEIMQSSDFFENIIIMENEALECGGKSDIRNIPMNTIDDTARKMHVDEILSNLNNQNEAVVITEAFSPFKITYVNKAWEELCQYSKEEVLGNTLSMIQGPLTDIGELLRLKHHLMRQETCQATLINYKKSGEIFLNSLQVIHSKYFSSRGDEPFILGFLRAI